jgi:hypothetical protein
LHQGWKEAAHRFDRTPAWEVSTPLSVEAALQRLNAALAQLEEAAEHRIELDRTIAGRGIEVQALSEDRSRLAQELDASYARFSSLESANRDVSRRLDQAMGSIRHVLEPIDR